MIAIDITPAPGGQLRRTILDGAGGGELPGRRPSEDRTAAGEGVSP